MHDTTRGKWTPTSVQKLNVDKRPVNLSLEDLTKVCQPGIDAVWEHNGQITVTEAKASSNKFSVINGGRTRERNGKIPRITGVSNDLRMLHYLLSDSSDKRGTQMPLMQMSKAWVEDRAKREDLPGGMHRRLEMNNANRYTRRTVLVTFESGGALDHE